MCLPGGRQDGCITVGLRVEPNFMGTRGVTVEDEPKYPQASDNQPIAEASEASY